MAVDELCYMLVGSHGGQGQINLTFDIDDESIAVRGESTDEPRRPEFAELSEQILRAIAQDYVRSADGGTVTFRMVRRRHDG
jgi:hypothetical protein